MGGAAAADQDDLQELKHCGRSERGLSGGPLGAPGSQGTASPLIGMRPGVRVAVEGNPAEKHRASRALIAWLARCF